ncbi:hypothetical protein [Coprothermobacter proteolyticus]|uniref:hypothetical protein n=1 Tax=Coprothermobacter proteolyticus TaxID=35786 RepID=UPI000D30DB52|nr:hypothetical protein [Coprothermobacter proteolyticus]
MKLANRKGFALVTVIAFIVILSFLIMPIAVAVTGIAASMGSIQLLPAKHEAFSSGVNLVKQVISYATSTATAVLTTYSSLAQGELMVSASTSTQLYSVFDSTAAKYWTVMISFTPNPKVCRRAQCEPYILTGTAVQYMLTPSTIYIVDLQEK